MEPVSTSTFRWSQRQSFFPGQIENSFLSAKKAGATILIVEDEILMLRLLVRFFTRHGYHVLQAGDGEQAVDIYRRQGTEIDVVLLDILLPNKTGAQVFREMKVVNPAVKVVVASGYLDPQIKADMSVAGIKRFVDKPYILDDVRDVVESMLASD
jgi:two-component system, cell cycle sensor histidine kinase and response regulator CckA